MDASSTPKVANLHANETERLQALRSYGILDTAIESSFDDITRIASYVCETPVALISLVDEGRQWFKSARGFDGRETPLEQSICAHALLEQSFLEVEDTTKDPRFDCNPLVTGNPHVRFYAGALLRTPDGLPLGTVCVLDNKPRVLSAAQRDVLSALARQVMSQMEFRRALVLSDQLQRNISRLMAVAGHDLKQPLQVMVMAIDRISHKLTDEKDRERLGYAINAGMRMAEELDRLAETSVLQTGYGVPELKSLPIADVFDSIDANWRLHAEAKGLELVVVPSRARVVSDPTMLRTILGNLVGNAIKYTSRGRVLVGCRRHGCKLSIEVLDSGPGIAHDQRDAIFEAFHQVNPDSEGLGLGLSIVRRTAEALGHTITLKSDLTRGSHFSIRVPLAAAVVV
ncbi:GAF domain-containing sensor histidine kinase [Tardiphaga sp.]|uniref:GAF domain-containing sensor histidine kinase n=1 Tax=Tardiphaga sp. TaxID=1926292 RepID=UPI0026079117|nr:GAF domain-containing sensor histidine kinase [Tardiphaga sp.]MDB5616007.1 histidine kinase [Tardiphaga sp.]